MRTNLIAHLQDLKEKSILWHKTISSDFLDEIELIAAKSIFPSSDEIVYFGGYDKASKQKVIFTSNGRIDDIDIVCLKAEINQRFCKINHRDVFGALMALQVERKAFGDFWIEDTAIYLYTSKKMVTFFKTYFKQVNQLKIQWQELSFWPKHERKFIELELIIAANRLDAIVASLAKISRSAAKKYIFEGMVSYNHKMIEDGNKMCHNGSIISIRGCGRFLFVAILRQTKSGRLVAKIKHFI